MMGRDGPDEPFRRAAIIGVVVVAVVGAVAGLRLATSDDGSSTEARFTVSETAAAEAREEAGCTVPDEVPRLSPTPHLELTGAPPADRLYPDLRPTASGQHAGSRIVPVGTYDEPIDERVSTHNLEHGAVIVWYDPEQVTDEEADFIEGWAEGWNDAGFGLGADVGGGVIVAPYDGPFTTGRSVALRAWDRALDCEEFAVAVGDAFVARHFGTRGEAPERHLVPYPTGLLELVD